MTDSASTRRSVLSDAARSAFRGIRLRLLPPGTPLRRLTDLAVEPLVKALNSRIVLAGNIENLTWLDGSTLVCGGWFPLLPGQALRVQQEGGAPVGAMFACFSRGDCPGPDTEPGKIVILSNVAPDVGWVTFQVAGRTLRLEQPGLRQLRSEPERWAERVCLPTNPEQIALLAHRLAMAATASPTRPELWTHRARALQALLDTRLPRNGANCFEAELLALDERTLLLTGEWNCAVRSPTLLVTTPEGVRVNLTARSHWLPLPGRSGRIALAALVVLDYSSPAPGWWKVELQDKGVPAAELRLEARQASGALACERMLGWLKLVEAGDETGFARIVLDAARVLVRRPVASLREVAFGTMCTRSELSIVIPCSTVSLSAVEHTLVQLAGEGGLEAVDLVLVVEAESELALARDLHRLYRLPFRVLLAETGESDDVACDLGAAAARGRLLLLLQPLVLPEEPGWIAALRAFHALHAPVGAVGAKLVDAYDNVWSAGLDGGADRVAAPVSNRYRGRPRHDSAVCMPARVSGISAACLLVERSLYLDAGGLAGKGEFVFDRADLALCARLEEHGHPSWYCADVELRFLGNEGQSVGTSSGAGFARRYGGPL